VSGRGSGDASYGGSRDCADRTCDGRADNGACRRSAGGSHSGTKRMSAGVSRRVDRFTGRVSRRGSGYASYGGANGRADRATHGRADNRAGRRTASRSHSGTNGMRTRLSRRFNFLFDHDERPPVGSIVRPW
jgi:hypothetical protein